MMRKQRLEHILHQMKTKRILVVGDLMLDQYLWGKADRISPEAPVPVVRVLERTFNFGGAANVAQNLISLQAHVHLVGVVGNDVNGEILVNKLNDLGVTTRGICFDPQRETTLKTRVIAQNQQVVRIDNESNTSLGRSVRESLFQYVSETMPDCDALIVSDYSKGVITEEMFGFLKEKIDTHHLFWAIDPKVDNFRFYKGATVITPNHHEASAAINLKITDIESLQRAGKRLLEQTGCPLILITWGKRGMGLFNDKGTFHHIETVGKRVFDVTGAGDTVIAVFTLACVAGASPLEAAEIANRAAGQVISQVGTASVTPEELLTTFY